MRDIPYLTYQFPDSINLYPIFDVHYGSAAHCEAEFRQYLDLILEDPVGYCVLGGDLVNNNVVGGPGLPHEDIINPMMQKRDMVDLLKPLAVAGRILASVRGNHEFRTMKNAYQDVASDIMSKLDLEDRYKGDRAILQIQIGTRQHGKNKATPGVTYYILVTHGSGGGKKPGSTLNNADDLIKGYGGLDVSFSGHTHKPMMEFAAQTVLNLTGYHDKSCLVCVASSWMSMEEQGYPVRKGLSPVDTCQVQKVTLHPPRKLDGGPDIEFNSFHLRGGRL